MEKTVDTKHLPR